jgi:hypothetical protein
VKSRVIEPPSRQARAMHPFDYSEIYVFVFSLRTKNEDLIFTKSSLRGGDA